MFQLFRTPSFDFMGHRSIGYVVSAALIVASIGIIGWRWSTTGEPVKYGIDFSGGSLFQVRFAQPPSVDQLRSRLAAAGFGSATLQRFTGEDDDTVLIRVGEHLEDSPDLVSRIIDPLRTDAERELAAKGRLDLNTVGESDLAALLEREVTGQESKSRDPVYVKVAATVLHVREGQAKGLFSDLEPLRGASGISAEVFDALEANTYTGSLLRQRTESVGPSVGAGLRRQAIFASLVANALILLYLAFRFEIRFGVAAVVTLVHDLLIILGVFSLTGREFDLPVLAAMLTVIGYSVNDTIVVFDRIRGNLKIMRRESLAEVVNASLNQTLSRTVMTSGSTLLVVVPLLLFGGVVLNNFAFALLLGVIIGTYSSVFVASPLLVLWQRYVVK